VLTVEIANEQKHVKLDRRRIQDAVRQVLQREGFDQGAVSVAVVDDARIAALNEQYLGIASPTDVLSFTLESSAPRLEGQLVLSAETAAAAAPRYGWPPGDELLLYAVHGTLHLAGYDDATPSGRAAMRRRERTHLARFGLAARYRAAAAGRRGSSSNGTPP
jgi:probable rRNA maturation factor